MGHCGGEGPSVFDALEQWVEQKKALDSIVASHSTAGKVDRTRPLCAFPQVAKYKGSGTIDDAANFSCALPYATTAAGLRRPEVQTVVVARIITGSGDLAKRALPDRF
jgi:hypothetical protein